jgi:phosphatidylinositol N-acetylglucosaminyltransferase subunit P
MPPESRGPSSPLTGFQSNSTPNLPTIGSLSKEAEHDALPALPPEPLLSEAASYEAEAANGESFSSESDSSEGEGVHSQGLHHRRLYSNHSSRSHTHLPPSSSQLFPPFYNRPPTPLPPSPSLTSLLRPSFSTHTSHPTTPESSDTESQTGASTAAAVAKSARNATAVPRASPKVPTYEYYGFAVYLASSGAFLMYLLWAFLPSPFLHQLGIHYYPNRWWAIALPAWLIVLLVYIYVALASYNTGYLTLPMSSIENIVDEAAQIAVVDREGKIIRQKKNSRFDVKKGKYGGKHSRQSSLGIKMTGIGLVPKDVDWKSLWNEGTDAVMDVPIGGVCEILYGAGREEEEADDAVEPEAT